MRPALATTMPGGRRDMVISSRIERTADGRGDIAFISRELIISIAHFITPSAAKFYLNDGAATAMRLIAVAAMSSKYDDNDAISAASRRCSSY